MARKFVAGRTNNQAPRASDRAMTEAQMICFMGALKAKVASGEMSLDEAKEARKVIFVQVSQRLGRENRDGEQL